MNEEERSLDHVETYEMSPIEKLDAVKTELTQKIAATKMILNREKKKLTQLEKLNIEIITDKNEKIAEQHETIIKISDELTTYEIDLKELNRTKDDETEEKIQTALGVVIDTWLAAKPSAGYVIDDEEFVYIEDFSDTLKKQNVLCRKMPPRSFVELLANDLGLKSWHLPVPRVKDLFNSQKRTYSLCRYSIEPARWKKDYVYLPIVHMEQYFICNLASSYDGKEYNKAFEYLMYSLSGGKRENQEHIERWILHKIINYKKAVTTPDLVIVGHVGGNGKGIIQAIIRLMLPSSLSGKANSKTLNGNFNAIMMGKLIVFFDDQTSKEIPLEVVKQMAGSDTLIFEPKGKDQFEGEQTHSSAWFSNILPFPLTPAGQEGGVDRRFSILRTSTTFLESIRLHLKEESGLDVTIDESKDLAESLVSDILLDRTEIARWFAYLMKKHPEVNTNYTLKPLHGEDYHYFLDRQKTSFDTIWHGLVQPILSAGGCVPVFVVKELCRHMDSKTYSDKVIVSKMKDLASQNKVDIDFDRTHITITPSVVDVTKQCSIMKIRGTEPKEFDWSAVSNRKYERVSIGRDLIEEDNLVFGVGKNEDDDEHAHLFSEDGNEIDEDYTPVVAQKTKTVQTVDLLGILKGRLIEEYQK